MGSVFFIRLAALWWDHKKIYLSILIFFSPSQNPNDLLKYRARNIFSSSSSPVRYFSSVLLFFSITEKRIKDYCLITFHEKIISITSISQCWFSDIRLSMYLCCLFICGNKWLRDIMSQSANRREKKERMREFDMIKRFRLFL